MNVLITGGAGFIGTHLTKRLLDEGCTVTILDNFSPQIHGAQGSLSIDIAPHVRLIGGDVRDRDRFTQALTGQEVVVHLAAETGTGQSMYEVQRYEQVNMGGTSVLFDLLVNTKVHQIQKVVVASSRAIYGEGKYRCTTHGVVFPTSRRGKDLQAGLFEPRCPVCSAFCEALPTDETTPLQPASFYGLTKQMQEQMVLLFAHTLGISAFALRYQNVYGPGQSLQNPYTGILAIFSNLARANQPIKIFEDGEESRDFVYIDDVVEATWRCIQPQVTGIAALNVGSGQRTTVRQVVEEIVTFFQSYSAIHITGEFRLGDIRHNVADLKKVSEILDFKPKWTFNAGIRAFLAWAEQQATTCSNYEQSLSELRQRNLFGKAV